MNITNKEDEKRLMALKYIAENECGILDELINEIGEDYVDEFFTLGFIRGGYTRHFKTWHITEHGKEYYNVVK